MLSPEEFLKLGGVFAEFGIPAVRLTFEQNILVPALHVSAPAAFYRALKQLGPDYTFESFAGQLDCCIGATICKIGVLDTPKYGAVVGEALDRYFEAHPEKRAKAALLLPELLESFELLLPESLPEMEESVFAPATPSAERPLAFWKARTAAMSSVR